MWHVSSHNNFDLVGVLRGTSWLQPSVLCCVQFCLYVRGNPGLHGHGQDSCVLHCMAMHGDS